MTTPDILEYIRARLSVEQIPPETINRVIGDARTEYGGGVVYVRTREPRPLSKQYVRRKQRQQEN